ncbi:MAG TPA: cupin domain-containing protein [Streptosporangiaceae bacterium]|nr:cupin domain-containing protein [Streptosporangiaceae bacterium]
MIPSLADAADIPGETVASGATVRPVLDVAGAAGGRLARRLVTVPAGKAYAGTAGAAGELWFVTSGSGSLETGGRVAAVGAEHGVAVAPGTGYRLTAAAAPRADGVLVVDIVTLPVVSEAAVSEPFVPEAAGVQVTDVRDCAAEVTGDREFRVLFGPGTGFPAATQFVGDIPPGRAPDHRHTYDETVLVLAGEGVVHLVADEPGGEVRLALAGRDAVYPGAVAYPVRPGSCIHLPPGQRHCLENTGSAVLRVLGVFQPGGSPAAKQPAVS